MAGSSVLLLVLSTALAVASPEKDGAKDDTETLQNASSSSIPREIPIGLPESGTGSSILENGLRLAHGSTRDYFHWAGGNAYSSTRLMSVSESVIQAGKVAMVVDSWTRLGEDTTHGAVTARTSTNGLIRLDGAVGGALSKAKGWYYSAGVYVNMDPTSVNAPTRPFVDQKQLLKLALTKRWAGGEASLMGRVTHCCDNSGNAYSYAPFIYNGDGTITTLDRFKLGRDCYFPTDDHVSYKDVVTGEERSGKLSKLDSKILYDADLCVKQNVGEWKLGLNAHFVTTGDFSTAENSMGGIVSGTASQYTTSDGKPYTGDVQIRVVTPHEMIHTDLFVKVSAHRDWRRNTLDGGLLYSTATQSQRTSSFYYAHTVEADPARIWLKGRETWNHNMNAMYFDAVQHNIALYATDNWSVTDRFFVRGGLRINVPIYSLNCASNMVDPETGVLETTFDRYDGFSLNGLRQKGIELNHLTQKDIDGLPIDIYSSAYLSYRVADGLFLLAEGLLCSETKNTTNYKGTKIPSTKPIVYSMARAGATWNKPFLDLSLVASYISCKNNASFGTISNPSGTLTNSFIGEYGIGTFGVTLDGTLKFGGFNLHALVTWQDPKYRDYEHTEHFSDGSVTSVNFSGKYVVKISRVRVEIDPSYSWDKWKVGANIRYFSRQYASRNNLAYFNGHFETFGSVDYSITKRSKLSLHIVNMLFQKGASGSISIADKAQSEEELTNLLLCGTYIRPFSVDLGYTFRF